MTPLAELMDRLRAAGLRPRPVWIGDDRRLRIGHSGDMVTMLDDMRQPTISSHQVRR